MFLVITALLSLSATSQQTGKAGDKIYYFCVSKPMAKQKVIGKEIIFLTSIQEGANDTGFISKRSQDFQKLASSKCENIGGCTSDLNYSATYETAKFQYNYFTQKYIDSTHYIVKKLNF